jgi:hypothetical protein
MQSSVISKIKMAITDFEMLQKEIWQPDNDSCQASIDNLETCLAQLDAEYREIHKALERIINQSN